MILGMCRGRFADLVYIGRDQDSTSQDVPDPVPNPGLDPTTGKYNGILISPKTTENFPFTKKFDFI
jgi:hypothetical protein